VPDLNEKLTNKTARVGVLMGGMSTEREISLKSGRAVSAALRSLGWVTIELDVGPDLPRQIRAADIDVAWIALHGSFGEDGCVQGLLEIMRIPYTGSDVRASALAMDKVSTKRLLRDTGVKLPRDWIWRAGEPIPECALPQVVKAPNGGSTIGVWICHTREELVEALHLAGEMDREVLVEDMIEGEEITVAVFNGTPLPVVLIQPKGGFFDFEAKYTQGCTDYLVPAPLPEAVTISSQQQAAEAYNLIGLHGIARADFIVTADGTPWFLEINTIPGMTATSLSPMAAGAAGIQFEDLVEAQLLGAALHRHPEQLTRQM
jgi:D-alanine-D-alanine ligase